jgi:hypothetical protein
MRKNKEVSKFLDLGPTKEGKGRRGYNPEQIYQYLYDNIDRTGVIMYTQKDMAEAIDMSREAIGNFYKDFETLGFLEKVDRWNFKVLYKPEEIVWDRELYDRFFQLRKRHQPAYTNKEKGE